MTNSLDLDMREVAEADVYIGEMLAAHLTRERGDAVHFDYVAHENVEGSVRDQSVSWSLLRSGEYPVITTGGAVPPFFAGLLPEGVRLGVVTSSMKTSADDHLTLLLAIGADTIGNIRVFPAGVEPVQPLPLFEPARDTDFRAVFAKLTGSVHADPVGLAGVQPKVSAAMLSTPTQTRAGPAILKLNPAQYPLLVENEHFFMRMASACGLRAAATALLHDAQGHSALLVSRFDRVEGRRIPQEDACQVAGLYPASKYRIKTETALTTLSDACGRGGGSRVIALLELLKVVVFSWLIGNGDLHGKNMSIYNPDGVWQPTPAYDLLCTQPYAGWNDPMALDLYGRANRLTRADFIDAGTRLGIRTRAIANMIDAIIDTAVAWPDRCGEIGFDDRQTERLATMLRTRLDNLR
ncbi:type II toxin-antitoxin system HipA family toxin [Mycobacterium sp. CVI_P3]|uniref:Type II toxin-antitoxin system HipA family toxin n=1 Tax=Mycobacterium pinniadriaticum TaxID=2994102 RepID=A0ABT3SPV7_9MYCO|nr:type II toxin-antitoxin system HipA family toxin [Mycobacterium pinniadriaticum]MCX2934811.1 type II toxin-antitoxin system HipA family toxin [Mycobacterium pinniadriaticum]MCX2941233.1 type II toxin-antitoxin system HipA family toxin [Mycobacterium pinniadriaticum]